MEVIQLINNKPIQIKIGPVAIVRDNSQNMAIYRMESVYNRFEKKSNNSYQFKGFYSSVLACLKAIQYKELLIDENEYTDLESYLKQVEKSNEKLIKVLEGDSN